MSRSPLTDEIDSQVHHAFNIKKDLKEPIHNYFKRFTMEKAKIIRCDGIIAKVAFRLEIPPTAPPTPSHDS